jgi:hypothetical protein
VTHKFSLLSSSAKPPHLYWATQVSLSIYSSLHICCVCIAYEGQEGNKILSGENKVSCELEVSVLTVKQQSLSITNPNFEIRYCDVLRLEAINRNKRRYLIIGRKRYNRNKILFCMWYIDVQNLRKLRVCHRVQRRDSECVYLRLSCYKADLTFLKRNKL